MRPFAHRFRHTALATSALGLLVIAPPAFAQEDGASAGGEDIVVTARRTEERLETVPVSVSAFSERALDRIQAGDTTGLQGAVPNLNIVQGRGSSNATNIYIRGIGQPDALQTFDPAVGVYVDDVYYSRIRGTQLDLLDLERVEVLRGPQGTLYGKNTIGGALKVVTRKPDQNFRGGVSMAYGSYDQFEVKASASGPVSDTLAAGFAVMHARRDGYVEDRVLDRDYNDKNTLAARGAIAFTPSADFRLDVSVDYSRDDAAMTVGQPLNSLTYLLGGTALALPANPDPKAYDFTGRTTPGLPNSTKLRHWGTNATATWDIADNLALKSITAYRRLTTDDYIDIDATELEMGDVFVGVHQKQFSQELQLAYTGDRVQAVGGLYYLREDIDSHQEAYADDLLGPLFGNPTFLRTIDDTLTTKSYAAYANVSFAVTDALRLSGGLRYTDEKKDYWRTTSTFSSLPLFTSVAPYVFARQQSWDDWSPMASIDYRFSDNLMFYARAAKGFKSGGFNGRANSLAESTAYAPEKVWSYEAGFKGRVNDIARFSIAVFHNDYKDFQARVSGVDTDPNTGLPLPVLSVLNAGKLQIRGAELELALTPVTGLLLDTQIGYLDAEYKQFNDARFPNGSRAFQRPAFAPKWTMRFGAQYEADLGGSGFLTIGGQTRYRSTTALAVDNTIIGTTAEIAGLFQKGYWLHDARIVWEDSDRKFSLGLYGQNLSDKNYKTDGQEFSSIGSIRTAYYGAPRTFTVRAGVKF
ncbi:TonB-dependent receptor [Sphingopyxis sp. DBS4]|uniref:TonB-dependent receptor n=1 Tax=Sphingopyxis sp. DBS4 TaxID=2968500 RepID=UPI00214AD386|nr:TonB-dependent receptor [Sphingopyxis sp. DBS4]